TEMTELNRVLGGGMVPGSLVLVGGDPGIGKSTLMLQACDQLTRAQQKVLYISGEESMKQTKLQADRSGLHAEQLYVLAEADLEFIEKAIADLAPQVLVIDSIQTIFRKEITSAPGSVSQVRECTSDLMRIAKTEGIGTFIIGHVTKEGSI